MDFLTYITGLDRDGRQALAEKAGTSVAMLMHIAHRRKPVELGFADVLVALTSQAVTLDEIWLTERAEQQRGIRDSFSANEAA